MYEADQQHAAVSVSKYLTGKDRLAALPERRQARTHPVPCWIEDRKSARAGLMWREETTWAWTDQTCSTVQRSGPDAVIGQNTTTAHNTEGRTGTLACSDVRLDICSIALF